jgi:hypothetical protein
MVAVLQLENRGTLKPSRKYISPAFLYKKLVAIRGVNIHAFNQKDFQTDPTA